jgi:hypothetical protein
MTRASLEGFGMAGDSNPRPFDKDGGDPTEPSGWVMRLKLYLSKRENQTLIGALVLFCGLLWIGLELIDKAKILEETLQGFLSNAFAPPATGHIERWFLFTAVFFLGVLFTAVLYSAATLVTTRALRKAFETSQASGSKLRLELQAACSERDQYKGALSQAKADKDLIHEALQKERDQFQTSLIAQKDRLDAIVSETVRGVSKISRQMFPAGGSAKGKTFRSARISYQVSKDFDAEVRRRYVIRAGDVPLHLWVSSIAASDDSEPRANFSDIEYQLIGRGSEAVYLPAENDRFNKSACIFFLPAIQPGEEREFEVVYRWPGLLRGLLRNGWEDFTFSFKSAEAIEDFEVEIFLEDGTGGQIYLTEIGLPLPVKSLVSTTNGRGWRGWRYAGKNISPSLLSDEIPVRLEWKR